MKHRVCLATLVAAAISLTACSHAAPATGVDKSVSPASMSDEPRWTAIIRPVSQDRLNVRDSTINMSSGSARWVRTSQPDESSVSLQFSYTGRARELTWGILYGPCGNASLPVVPLSNFPELDLTGGAGTARVLANIAFELPTRGEFHVEVYKDRRGGAEFVVGCGNMKLAVN